MRSAYQHPPYPSPPWTKKKCLLRRLLLSDLFDKGVYPALKLLGSRQIVHLLVVQVKAEAVCLALPADQPLWLFLSELL